MGIEEEPDIFLLLLFVLKKEERQMKKKKKKEKLRLLSEEKIKKTGLREENAKVHFAAIVLHSNHIKSGIVYIFCA